MNPGNSRARATLRNVLRGERNHRFALGGGLNLSSFSPDTERPNFLCIMGRKKFRQKIVAREKINRAQLLNQG